MVGKVYQFDLNLKGTMILPCARTLVDVKYPFSIDATENFTKVDYVASEEEEIFLVDQEVLDLEPYIKENILLEVPVRVYSDEEQLSEAEDEGEGWENANRRYPHRTARNQLTKKITEKINR